MQSLNHLCSFELYNVNEEEEKNQIEKELDP
jgi:hypothetical protein